MQTVRFLILLQFYRSFFFKFNIFNSFSRIYVPDKKTEYYTVYHFTPKIFLKTHRAHISFWFILAAVLDFKLIHPADDAFLHSFLFRDPKQKQKSR